MNYRIRFLKYDNISRQIQYGQLVDSKSLNSYFLILLSFDASTNTISFHWNISKQCNSYIYICMCLYVPQNGNGLINTTSKFCIRQNSIQVLLQRKLIDDLNILLE